MITNDFSGIANTFYVSLFVRKLRISPVVVLSNNDGCTGLFRRSKGNQKWERLIFRLILPGQARTSCLFYQTIVSVVAEFGGYLEALNLFSPETKSIRLTAVLY